jgi:hypothetical protein
MEAHPIDINYGNTPPIGSFLKIERPNSKHYEEIPDYPVRRRYKIDWKVCSMKWINQHYYHYSYYNSSIIDVDEKEGNEFYDPSTAMNRYPGSAYHVYVEDDSFVCSENLIFQLSSVYNVSKKQSISEFRTGTRSYDGFDDSSTIMSSKIARTFVNHYLEENFNCSHVFPNNDSLPTLAVWLSWGNSWRNVHCGWASAIWENYHYHINKPFLHCSLGQYDMEMNNITFPCLKRPLVFHNSDAMEALLKDHSTRQIYHMCEYMLLIDKVKSPELMTYFWNKAAISNHFHNFTSVFINDDFLGWSSTIKQLQEEEEYCERDHPLESIDLLERLGNVSNPHYNASLEMLENHKVGFPCLSISRKKRKIRRRLLSSYSNEEKPTPYYEYESYFDSKLLFHR